MQFLAFCMHIHYAFHLQWRYSFERFATWMEEFLTVSADRVMRIIIVGGYPFQAKNTLVPAVDLRDGAATLVFHAVIT